MRSYKSLRRLSKLRVTCALAEWSPARPGERSVSELFGQHVDDLALKGSLPQVWAIIAFRGG
jgi:hypothetical protein